MKVSLSRTQVFLIIIGAIAVVAGLSFLYVKMERDAHLSSYHHNIKVIGCILENSLCNDDAGSQVLASDRFSDTSILVSFYAPSNINQSFSPGVYVSAWREFNRLEPPSHLKGWHDNLVVSIEEYIDAALIVRENMEILDTMIESDPVYEPLRNLNYTQFKPMTCGRFDTWNRMVESGGFPDLSWAMDALWDDFETQAGFFYVACDRLGEAASTLSNSILVLE